MPALSAVLLIFSLNSVCSLLFSVYRSLGRTSTIGFNAQYRTSDVAENVGKYFSGAQRTA